MAASINQFKLLKQKCATYYTLFETELKLEIQLKKDSDMERFGFYLFILECITKVKDITNLTEIVTDTDFNKVIFNDNSKDYGIDAIYIDDEDSTISLFNFKYRDNFNEDKKQSVNDVFISSKFTNAIVNLSSDHFEGKLKKYAEKIIKRLKSREVWKMKLYMVSNENKGIDESDYDVEELKKLYDLEVLSITLTDIANFMSLRPEPVSSKFVLPKESVLSYSESTLSSSKSYVVKLPALELIRITSNSVQVRDQYNMEDYSSLSSSDLEYSVLFDNVRGFLGDTKYNTGMLETLKKEPTKFFMYNNGLTVTADILEAEETNGKTKIKFDVKNMQVVNGGQTLRTLHKFKSMDSEHIDKYLSESEILVRLFKTSSSDNLTRKIAEYTNSQNAISAIDLKSLADVQLHIEQFLDDNNIIYARKIGDTGMNASKVYEHKISMEKLAQILISLKGYPNKASNQKKKLFDKHYKDIFGEDNFVLEDCAKTVRRYYEIKNIYDNNTKRFSSTDQKIFYIMYLDQHLEGSIIDMIDVLEKIIENYRKEDFISSARKLIENGFLEEVNSYIENL